MLRDNESKKRLGYKHPKSKVYFDGSEVLHGEDWKQRKFELFKRCGGRCEVLTSDGERCKGNAMHPHHRIKRSRKRDDRMANLVGICDLHHQIEHPEKNRLYWTPKEERNAKQPSFRQTVSVGS